MQTAWAWPEGRAIEQSSSLRSIIAGAASRSRRTLRHPHATAEYDNVATPSVAKFYHLRIPYSESQVTFRTNPALRGRCDRRCVSAPMSPDDEQDEQWDGRALKKCNLPSSGSNCLHSRSGLEATPWARGTRRALIGHDHIHHAPYPRKDGRAQSPAGGPCITWDTPSYLLSRHAGQHLACEHLSCPRPPTAGQAIWGGPAVTPENAEAGIHASEHTRAVRHLGEFGQTGKCADAETVERSDAASRSSMHHRSCSVRRL